MRLAVGKRQEEQRRIDAEIDRCVVHMVYGDRGAHKGVLVENGDGWTGVSLREVGQDPRVVAGAIVYVPVMTTRVVEVFR